MYDEAIIVGLEKAFLSLMLMWRAFRRVSFVPRFTSMADSLEIHILLAGER